MSKILSSKPISRNKSSPAGFEKAMKMKVAAAAAAAGDVCCLLSMFLYFLSAVRCLELDVKIGRVEISLIK